MSQISVDQIIDVNGGNAVQINGVTPTAESMQGFRNRLINGDMRTAQRGTSAAINGTTPTYFVDRFAGRYSTSVTGTLSQQTTGGLSGFTNCARAQRTSGQTTTGNLSVLQILETLNCTDLAGGSVTFSFWARAGANYSATSSGLTAAVYTGTGTDQSSTSFMAGSWTGQTAIINSGVTLTTSWQRFTLTGSVGVSATQLGVLFQGSLTGTAGAADFFEVTGVQLEAGSVATAFERRPYGTELALCQRYYEGTTALQYRAIAAASYANSQNFSFLNEKRAAPTIAIFGISGTSGVYDRDGVGNTAVTATSHTHGFRLNLSAGHSGVFGMTASAEL